MNENAVALRLARQSDLPFIMATERLPGFEQMVGRWSEAEHLATLARPNHAYLLGTNTAGECAAFAIIRDLDDAHGNLCLKRIAVTNPDRGFGSKFLSLVVDWAFSEIACHRLWLEVLVNNARARHVYSSHGFADEGLLRGAFKLPDDSRTDLVLMSLTRPEWIGLRGKHA
jgi:ribosomal protein S18 acetylase RimI-like enzyme